MRHKFLKPRLRTYHAIAISPRNAKKLTNRPSNHTVKAPSKWFIVKTICTDLGIFVRSRIFSKMVTSYRKSLFNLSMMPASVICEISRLNGLSSGKPRSVIISNGLTKTSPGNGKTSSIVLLCTNIRFSNKTRLPSLTSCKFSNDGQNGSE